MRSDWRHPLPVWETGPDGVNLAASLPANYGRDRLVPRAHFSIQSLFMHSLKRHFEWSFALIVFIGLCSLLTSGYSVLTHEQVVDLMWNDQIQPLLLKRFPDATEQDLQKAHAYAYGGCVLQDMGYYPFGNKFFSDLVHYVRSGDFVEALLRGFLRPQRVRFRAGRALALCFRQQRASHHQPRGRPGISQTAKEVWRQRNLC